LRANSDRALKDDAAQWPSPSWRSLLALSVGYGALACAGIALSRIPGGIATLWFANVLALVAMLALSPMHRVHGAMAILLGAVAANLLMGNSPGLALAMALSNVAEVVLATVLVARARVFPADTVRSYLILQAIAAGIAPSAGGAIAATALYVVADADFIAVWWSWVAGSALGAISVMPLVLTWSRGAIRTLFSGRTFAIWAALLVACTASAMILLTSIRFPFVVISVPLIVAATLTTPLGTALIAFCTALAIVVGSVLNGFGATADGTRALFTALVHFVIGATVFLPFCVAMLLDELRRDRASLTASEARFRSAMADSALGMAILGPDGALLDVNRAVSELLGYSPAELMRLTSFDITHPDDRDVDQAQWQRLIAGQIATYTLEKRYIRKDGRSVWVSRAVSKARDDNPDAPLRLIAQVENIDARKRAEAALAAAESRWNFALESAGQGVWDANLVTQCTFYSRTYKAMLGYEDDEWTDRADEWSSRIHPSDWEAIRQADIAHLSGQTPTTEGTFRMRHKDGHWVWILDRGCVIERAPDGQPLRMIGTHTDITAQKNAEDKLRVLSQRIRMATQGGGVGLWEWDVRTNAVWWDTLTLRLFDVPASQADDVGRVWEQRVHPDDMAPVRRQLHAIIAGQGGPETGAGWDYRIVLRNGALRHIRARAQLEQQADGTAKLVGANWDITEQKRLEEALYEEKERLRVTLHSMGDAVICTDAQGRITYLNPIAETMTGWTAIQACGQAATDVFRVVDDENSRPLANPITECLRTQRPYYLQERASLICRDGHRLAISDSAAPILSPTGALTGAVLLFQDVTKARAVQRDLTHAALHDALTGLANRLAFERALNDAVAEAGDSHRQHALCFIDLDRFKIVNDTAGHAAGDALLREIAANLRTTIRGHDLIARLGGDEFAVLLRDCTLDDAERIGNKLIQAVKGLRFTWHGRAYDVGASVGITSIEDASVSASEIMIRADLACYASKSGGRGIVSLYRPGDTSPAPQHSDVGMATRLKAALAAGRFVLFAHETHDLQAEGMPVRHLEVLTRMVDDDGTLIEPSRFIPAAERFDLIGQIDRWVIHTVMALHGAQIMAVEGLTMSINLSAQSLGDRLLWAYIHDQMQECAFAPDRLNIEITETAVINNIAAAERLTSTARAAGCHVTLDDFGSGLSSFSYLKRFQIDHIKIDGGFVRNMRNSPFDHAIVRVIHHLGQTIGVQTIAEFVQDTDTITALRDIGVNLGQGFVFGQPRPLEDVLKGLR
jgi:diguanylate cyclase